MIEKEFKEFNFNLIGKGSKISGELQFSGSTLISSHISGKIEIKDQGKLTIERDAQVDADITCCDCDIFGKFNGKIMSTGSVSIKTGAQVKGAIDAKILNIAAGAKVEIEGNTLD